MRFDLRTETALVEILDEDELGLLSRGTERGPRPGGSEPIREQKLLEILEFVEMNDRLPLENSDSVYEKGLATRLSLLLTDSDAAKRLSDLDPTGLIASQLPSVSVSPGITSELLRDSALEDLMKLKHVPRNNRLNPNYMERRTRCLDFYRYEDLFLKVHSDLVNRRRSLMQFQVEDLRAGSLFVLGGVIGLLVETDKATAEDGFGSGSRTRTGGRTLCVFDNGTQSRMLFRSLVKGLQVDGFLITGPDDNPKKPEAIISDDQTMGYIYVLQTLHKDFRSLSDFYKIGYTSGAVSTRLANAESEATYLFSKVQLRLTYRCYNIDAAVVEDQVHAFFDRVRVDLEVRDSNDRTFRPREWFRVQLDHIDRAIELFIGNELSNFYYDPLHGCIRR